MFANCRVSPAEHVGTRLIHKLPPISVKPNPGNQRLNRAIQMFYVCKIQNVCYIRRTVLCRQHLISTSKCSTPEVSECQAGHRPPAQTLGR